MPFGVAMVASVFHPSVGGIQTHTLQLSRKLRARGLDVAVLTRAAPGWPAEHELEGVPVFRLGTARFGGAVAAVSYIEGCVRFLARQRARFSVVHAHQMLSPMTVGLATRRLLSLPLVVNPHSSGPDGDVQLLQHRRPLGRLRLRAATRWADAFVSISDAITDELRSAGVPASRIHCIANGVDLASFPRMSPPARLAARAGRGLPPGPLVVYAGRLSREKGVDVLLEAWPALLQLRPDAQLALVGDGADGEALRRQAATLGVSSSVHFVGRSNDVPALLSAAEAFVLPSRIEGLSVALLEAMAAGLPIVATAVGGTPQVIQDRTNGLLVPPEAPDILTRALSEALGPSGELLGQSARATVRAHYSLDAIAEQTEALYRAVLRDSPSTEAAGVPA